MVIATLKIVLTALYCMLSESQLCCMGGNNTVTCFVSQHNICLCHQPVKNIIRFGLVKVTLLNLTAAAVIFMEIIQKFYKL